MQLKCYGKECIEDGIKFDRDQLKEYKGKRYCLTHYIQKMNDSKERNQLIVFLKTRFRIQYPTGLMLKQMKSFHDDLGYSYRNIITTIEVIDSKNNVSMDISRGLGLVPYFYEEAMEISKKNENLEIETRKSSKVVIPKNRVVKTNEYKKKKIFDFGE